MTIAENLDLLRSTKTNIKAAIEDKGVTVGDVPFSQYAEKIGEISGGAEPVLEELNVTNNGIYTPAEGVDGYNRVTVDVPVEGITEEQYTQGTTFTVLSNNATKVRSYGFYSDSNLTVVNLPMCERLEDYAFQTCRNLSVLSLPKCTNIGTYALGGCSALASIDLPECSYIGTGGFSYGSFSLVSLPKCRNIGNYGFTNCTKLINIDLPVCSTLGAAALSSCTSLSYANLPLLSSLASSVFTNCFRLASVSIPMCTFVGTNAFLKCSELTSVDIPLISSFGNTVFQSCTKLMELHLGSSTYTIANYGTNMFSNATAFLASGSIYVPACNYSKYITTTGWSSLSARFVSVGDPDEVMLSVDADGRLYGNTEVLYSGFSTFVGTNNITAVDLPNLRTLGSVGFNGRPITYISMPACTYVGSSAFTGIKSLITVNLPVCEILETNAFNGCTSLQTIDLPACTYVSNMAFANCTKLQTINLPECTSVGKHAFNACSSLQSIDLPLCSYVGSSAFIYCSALQTVSLPECTTVSEYAFSGCSKLKSIDLPVCSILEQNAFYTCRGLRSIYLRYPSICQGNASMFYLTPMYDSTYLGYYGSIYVPASLVDAYKVAPYWSGYSNRITAIPE